ncbi:hypothetical protein [Sphingosinicella humi]|uniref:Uncharacterized protein n=1 Tax=Allosphingosinicella humi TaxID=2068657 RepID=A0A2U2J0E1_9SPHN|nr:hypothetical protein [Sphingosinicella humi]PWG01777.1 hypothetical protein DF286_02000 [Sphingosinicella humi]
MIELLLPLGVLFILYLYLRAVVELIRHWISNRTIREAINKQPEAVGPLIEKLGMESTRWTPRIVGWMIVAGSLALPLIGLLEWATGFDPNLLLALAALAVGLTLVALGRRRARLVLQESRGEPGS